MSHEIELIGDGDGIAMFGDPGAVEQFLAKAGVSSKEISLGPTLGSTLHAGSGAAQAGSQIAANTGHWVKLTDESAKALSLGKLMTGSSEGVSRAVVTTGSGKITKILEFAQPGSLGSVLTNPAMLAGAAGIMAQLAMQQTMEEITQYLAVIDAKVDDVLRAQKDTRLAEMIGVGLVIDDALLKREHVGRVSEVTWSGVQGTAQSIAATQAYALRQLDAIAEKLEKKQAIRDLARESEASEQAVAEWLAVLARCFQLQDSLAVLELDRVLDSTPEQLDRHREAVQAGRQRRRELIASTTARLLGRIDATAQFADKQVLMHPVKAGLVARSSNEIGADISDFNSRVGIQHVRESFEHRRWGEAVVEARNTVVRTGATGVATTARLGTSAAGTVKLAAANASSRISKRFPRGRVDDPEDLG